MDEFVKFLLLALSQFAGGPGAMENNLVRFLIPAGTYGTLMVVAWSRQRRQDLPREKLLIWGFGLGAASGIVMAAFVSLQMLNLIERASTYAILVPLERALSMASVIVVAGAFLRYILEDARLAAKYLWVGLGITLFCLILAWWQWPRYLATLTEQNLHTSMVSWTFQTFTSLLLLVAIVLIQTRRTWLSNLVTVALVLFLAGELLFLVNFALNKGYNNIICPIGNMLPLLAIPLLGFVYLREQTLEKQRVQDDLEHHRRHLEELVTERTAEIAEVNRQLKEEIHERKQAQEALERLSHQYELILESASEGICGLDNEGRFVFVNSAAASLLGYHVDELVGQPCHPIWHHSRIDLSPYPESECPICDGYKLGKASRLDDQIFWKKDNTSFPVSIASSPTFESGKLTGSVVVFKDITERKQAEAELAQRNVNLAAQNAIADTLSRSLDLEKTLDHALDAVLSIVPMELGLVFLWDPAEEEPVLQNYRGPILESEPFLKKQEWTCCAMISREAMKRGRPVIKPVAECPAARSSLVVARSGLKTLISFPLVSVGHTLGALTLGSRLKEPVQPPELELLTIIGQQIGMAIENAHLYRKAEQAAEELALLHQVSVDLISTFSTERIYQQIAERSVKLMECQMACILKWNEDEEQVRLLACHGLSEAEEDILESQQENGNCLQTLIDCHEPLIIRDVQDDGRVPEVWKEKLRIQALLCVPIRGMNQSLGTLLLMDKGAPNTWRDEKRVLFESFVNRAAVALMNAEMHRQLEWTAALEERQRIAADMHDGLAQTVSLLGLQIDQATDLLRSGSTEDAVNELQLTRDTIKHISTDVRRSITSLQRAPQLRRSIQELLTNLPEQLAWEDGMFIQFISNVQEPLFLPQEQGNQAMFIVQEALLNAHRHAHARRISVTLDQQDRDVLICVEDDGSGFEMGAWWEGSKDHFGLGIMHSRAARISARLKIDSKPGQGTRVLLILPPVDRHVRKKSADSSLPASPETAVR